MCNGRHVSWSWRLCWYGCRGVGVHDRRRTHRHRGEQDREYRYPRNTTRPTEVHTHLDRASPPPPRAARRRALLGDDIEAVRSASTVGRRMYCHIPGGSYMVPGLTSTAAVRIDPRLLGVFGSP